MNQWSFPLQVRIDSVGVHFNLHNNSLNLNMTHFPTVYIKLLNIQFKYLKYQKYKIIFWKDDSKQKEEDEEEEM